MKNTCFQSYCENHQIIRKVSILGKEIDARGYVCSQDGINYPEKPPKTKLQLTILPTSFCAGKCPFCIATNTSERNSLDIDKLEKALEALHKEDCVRGISVSGGEPFTDIEMLNAIIDLVYGIWGTGLEFSINTNGYRLSELHKIHSLQYFDCLHISRHHYDDKINESLFGIKVPGAEEIREIFASVPYKDVFVFNCMLMKDYIGTEEEVHRYLDFAIEEGAWKASFITGTPINDFVKNQAVDYNKVFRRDDPSMLYTRGYTDFDFCSCQDGVYASKDGRLMRFYGRSTNPGGCEYARILSFGPDNHLRCNYNGEIII